MYRESRIEYQVSSIEHLEFSHFVVATTTGVIFASARDSNNKVYNFLINDSVGEVMEQVHKHFELVSGKAADRIREAVRKLYGVLPTFRTTNFNFN